MIQLPLSIGAIWLHRQWRLPEIPRLRSGITFGLQTVTIFNPANASPVRPHTLVGGIGQHFRYTRRTVYIRRPNLHQSAAGGRTSYLETATTQVHRQIADSRGTGGERPSLSAATNDGVAGTHFVRDPIESGDTAPGDDDDHDIALVVDVLGRPLARRPGEERQVQVVGGISQIGPRPSPVSRSTTVTVASE